MTFSSTYKLVAGVLDLVLAARMTSIAFAGMTVVCPPGTISADDLCMPCPADSIQSANPCIPCAVPNDISDAFHCDVDSD